MHCGRRWPLLAPCLAHEEDKTEDVVGQPNVKLFHQRGVPRFMWGFVPSSSASADAFRTDKLHDTGAYM